MTEKEIPICDSCDLQANLDEKILKTVESMKNVEPVAEEEIMKIKD